MRRFAVSYINFDDRELETKIVNCPTNNWEMILEKAFPDVVEVFENTSIESIEDAKELALDNEFMFEIVEIKES